MGPASALPRSPALQRFFTCSRHSLRIQTGRNLLLAMLPGLRCAVAAGAGHGAGGLAGHAQLAAWVDAASLRRLSAPGSCCAGSPAADKTVSTRLPLVSSNSPFVRSSIRKELRPCGRAARMVIGSLRPVFAIRSNAPAPLLQPPCPSVRSASAEWRLPSLYRALAPETCWTRPGRAGADHPSCSSRGFTEGPYAATLHVRIGAWLCQQRASARCCIEDEGRSFGVGLPAAIEVRYDAWRWPSVSDAIWWYMASGARSISPGHATAPLSMKTRLKN